MPPWDRGRLARRRHCKAYAIETEYGILLTPYDLDFLRVMEAEARISKRYQNALTELAR